MSVREDFFKLLPPGVDVAKIKAQLLDPEQRCVTAQSRLESSGSVVTTAVEVRQKNPEHERVKLPTVPTKINVTLPPAAKDSLDALKSDADPAKHDAAQLDLPTVVLVHGLGVSVEMYEPVIQAAGLREKYRVVTYDLEGHGGSPLHYETGPISIEKLVKTLREVISWVGAKKCIVVGWSVGGYIATSFAIAHPHIVSKLFLICPSSPMNPNDDKAAQWAAFLPLTLAQGPAPWTDYVQMFAFHPDTVTDSPLVKPFAKAVSLLTPTMTMAQYVVALYNTPPDLAALRLGQEGGVDGFLINGEYETGWPKGVLSEQAVETFRDAFKGREKLISKSGHFAILENSRAVAEELIAFLS